MENPLARHSWYLTAHVHAPKMMNAAAMAMVARIESRRCGPAAICRVHRTCSIQR
jgi:hypothetical protein